MLFAYRDCNRTAHGSEDLVIDFRIDLFTSQLGDAVDIILVARGHGLPKHGTITFGEFLGDKLDRTIRRFRDFDFSGRLCSRVRFVATGSKAEYTGKKHERYDGIGWGFHE